jgi:hypothetical protein
MKFIKRKIPVHRQEQKDATGEGYRHPYNIKESVQPVFLHGAPGDFEIVFKHEFLFTICEVRFIPFSNSFRRPTSCAEAMVVAHRVR